MPYITSWERIAMQKGMEQGLQQGIQQGMEQGQRQVRVEFLLDVLEERFGLVSSDVAEKVKGIDDMGALKDLCRKAIQCGSLEEFWGNVEEMKAMSCISLFCAGARKREPDVSRSKPNGKGQVA